MRSFVIALFILAILVGGVIVSRSFLVGATKEVSNVLEASRQAAETQDWEVAEEKFLEAAEMMREYLPTLSLLLDHEDVEGVMLRMRMMEQFLRQREVADSMAEGRAALFLLERIDRRSNFNLANIL